MKVVAQVSSFLSTPSAGEVADFAGRAAVALVLGALIGVERQFRQREAGLRTNAPVSLGAALFVLFRIMLAHVRGVDPTRIAAYVVSGIGFLGAGVILSDGVRVRGINTAATIWCSAAVGVWLGAGTSSKQQLERSSLSPAHGFLRPLARRIDRIPVTEESEVETIYTFQAVCRCRRSPLRAHVVRALAKEDFVLRAVRSEDLEDGDLVEVEAELMCYGRDEVALETAVSQLSVEPSVSSVEWHVIEPVGVVLAADE